MRFLRRSLVGLFLMALTIGVLAFAVGSVRNAVQDLAQEDTNARPARERIFAVNTVTLAPERIAPVLEVFGEVQSSRSLDVRSAAGGEVIELGANFLEGGRVQTGELLLRVDPADAQTALSLTQADLLDAHGELRDAGNGLVLSRDELSAAKDQAALQVRATARQQDLVDRGVGTAAALESAELTASSAALSVLSRRQAIQSAETRLSQAEVRLQRTKVSLAEAQRRLADTELYAAFEGTLADVNITQGGIVTANEQLAQLIDPNALEAEVRVSTSQYLRLLDDTGQLRDADVVARLDVFGVDLSAQGKISRESAAVGEGQTGRLLFINLDNARGFRPGDFVSVSIAEPAIDRVSRVPSSAVSSGNKILVIGEEDRLSEVEVDVVRRQGDDVLIRARGMAGAIIVAERSPLLGAGIRVRVIQPAGTEQAAPEDPAMVELSPERRAKIIAFIEGNNRMPTEAKARVLSQLEAPQVPAAVVERIEGRMGG